MDYCTPETGVSQWRICDFEQNKQSLSAYFSGFPRKNEVFSVCKIAEISLKPAFRL
jgi:hypothetical protein